MSSVSQDIVNLRFTIATLECDQLVSCFREPRVCDYQVKRVDTSRICENDKINKKVDPPDNIHKKVGPRCIGKEYCVTLRVVSIAHIYVGEEGA